MITTGIFAQNSANEITDIIIKVNKFWQESNPNHINSFWHPAAYHTGNMEAYFVTGKEEYKKYSEEWAKHNQWKGAKSDEKEKWRYSYGETDNFVLFGDWQICFQTYIDLYLLDKKPENEYMIARAKEVMEYQMSTEKNDYWWWADGLYMVMPVMTKLYKVTGNDMYLKKLYEYFSYARDLMYDSESGLFYRDAKYVYPRHKTNNELKDFWSRGNGWVFAGLAKVLQDLPATDAHRPEYIEIYKAIAASLKNAQQPEGHWTRSLLDPAHAPGYETSGTAFFTYGFLWGINNGILDRESYIPVINKSWRYLTETALQPDGKVGYVQPIGERADQHRNVGPNTTSDFGVGAYLLAASEMLRYTNFISAQRRNMIPEIRKNVPLDSIRMSDPAIMADSKTKMYYMTGTGGMMWKSKDLRLWEGPFRVAETPADSWMSDRPMIWAAEMHEYNGKYYYFGTFTNSRIKIDTVKNNIIDRRACHILVSDKPDGPYMPVGNENYCREDQPTLDNTLWIEDGIPYMLYCHEWLQNWNGTVEAVPLKPDFSGINGNRRILFFASESPWSKERISGNIVPNKVTDGPFVFRTKTGKLGMIWTSWIYDVYTQGVAYSDNGRLDGNWIHEKEPITPPNFGHGMFFRTFEGKLLMSVHSHENVNGRYIRYPRLFEMDDSGDKIIVKGEYKP